MTKKISGANSLYFLNRPPGSKGDKFFQIIFLAGHRCSRRKYTYNFAGSLINTGIFLKKTRAGREILPKLFYDKRKPGQMEHRRPRLCIRVKAA
jgi:hypothetical protein